MPKDKKGTYLDCIALVGTHEKCGEAVRIVITKQEAKIIYKAFKLPPQQRNLYVEKEMAKLKHRGVMA
jgi:hypothetical protein